MTRQKVLVADDVRDIRDMLRATLEPYYDVVVARNGEEAWELFNSEKPDIVLSDVVMPRIDGVELCRRIKLQSYKPETPVVIITGVTKERDLADGFWKVASGSDAFITKPFSPAAVLETVAKCLREMNGNGHDVSAQ